MAKIEVTARFKTPRVKSVQIHRLAAPKVNEKALRSAAAELGLDPASRFGTISSNRDKLTYTEGSLELTICRASGGMRFRDLTRWQMDDGGPDFEISDEAARRRADAILRGYKWDLGEKRFLKTARLRVGEASLEQKHSSERTIDVAVAFQRMVDGFPVDGPGGKTIVFLDRHGEATGVQRLWRNLDGAAGEGRLLPPDAAYEDLSRHVRAKRGVIEVTDIRLGYFEYGWGHRQRILQPAYVLIGYASAPDARARRKIVHVAPALERAPVQLTPPLRRKPPQPKRPARKAA